MQGNGEWAASALRRAVENGSGSTCMDMTVHSNGPGISMSKPFAEMLLAEIARLQHRGDEWMLQAKATLDSLRDQTLKS